VPAICARLGAIPKAIRFGFRFDRLGDAAHVSMSTLQTSDQGPYLPYADLFSYTRAMHTHEKKNGSCVAFRILERK
jgi:hypothetical protein